MHAVKLFYTLELSTKLLANYLFHFNYDSLNIKHNLCTNHLVKSLNQDSYTKAIKARNIKTLESLSRSVSDYLCTYKYPRYYTCFAFISSKQFTQKTSIDVLPSENQALCKYCTHVSNY